MISTKAGIVLIVCIFAFFGGAFLILDHPKFHRLAVIGFLSAIVFIALLVVTAIAGRQRRVFFITRIGKRKPQQPAPGDSGKGAAFPGAPEQ